VAGLKLSGSLTARGIALRNIFRNPIEVRLPQTPHAERHFTGSAHIRDIVIGMSDGLTVPFALAAGLSGAVSSTGIIITAGLAEVAAGSIAMGLGGYLASRSDSEHYESERLREAKEVADIPQAEIAEVTTVFKAYGLGDAEIAPIVLAFQKRPSSWVDFMMRFELGLERPDPKRALSSAFTIAASYVIGGLIPLLSYFAVPNVHAALLWSVIVTLIALFAFGYVKGRFTGAAPIRSGFQTVLIGGLAAVAAFGLARLFSR
jgi:VIT1/CCC1 family predicted Fe2+/Mn2+ transporter